METTTVRAEMSPCEANSVTLSDFRRDILGQPVARVSLKIDLQAIRAVVEHLNAELIRSGFGGMSIPQKRRTSVIGGDI